MALYMWRQSQPYSSIDLSFPQAITRQEYYDLNPINSFLYFFFKLDLTDNIGSVNRGTSQVFVWGIFETTLVFSLCAKLKQKPTPVS